MNTRRVHRRFGLNRESLQDIMAN